jgi:hypothetical protein
LRVPCGPLLRHHHEAAAVERGVDRPLAKAQYNIVQIDVPVAF